MLVVMVLCGRGFGWCVGGICRGVWILSGLFLGLFAQAPDSASQARSSLVADLMVA